MNYPQIFLKGMLVGLANVIPGVSGGTIAVVLHIFDQLIDAVNNFYKDWKKHFSFLIPLGLGALVAIFAFSRVLEFCLENYSMPTSFFFAGLVAGSLPLIYKEAKGKRQVNLIAFLIGLAVVAALSIINVGETGQIVTELSAKTAPMIFISGMIAAASMIMPGVSGSFVLMLLGYYHTFIAAISNLNFPILILGGIGIVVGVLLISKVIEILLKKAYNTTYSAILGLIVGSLGSILISRATYATGVSPLFIVLALLLAVVGFFTAYKLG